ncbi:MAG: alpha/beta fold hydrolase [Actinobacteria bacterium]|nr:alpha/beta fold hydrolase [Actinomycetota bacterium]
MLAPKAEPGTWVSDAARDKFMAAYDRAFDLWPQPYEEFDVETATTTTRVHAYRPQADGRPIVLLMGAGFNASYWYLHAAALAQAGPVFAIDTPGDPNPSTARAPITAPEASAAWLDEVLAQLSDGPAHLVGVSYGGWIAMNQAIRAPAPIASITLLDPAGLTKLDARFWWWLTISGLATKTPMPLRRRLARWLDSPFMLERELLDLMWAGSRGFRMEPKFPAVLTDDQLRQITVPVLLITGARSALITPAQARTRGAALPDAEVVIVPGSHGGFDRVDELNRIMVAFIAAHPADSAGVHLRGTAD